MDSSQSGGANSAWTFNKVISSAKVGISYLSWKDFLFVLRVFQIYFLTTSKGFSLDHQKLFLIDIEWKITYLLLTSVTICSTCSRKLFEFSKFVISLFTLIVTMWHQPQFIFSEWWWFDLAASMAFRVVRLRREARRNAKLDEIFQVFSLKISLKKNLPRK